MRNDETTLVGSPCFCRADGPKMKLESSPDIDLGVR